MICYQYDTVYGGRTDAPDDVLLVKLDGGECEEGRSTQSGRIPLWATAARFWTTLWMRTRDGPWSCASLSDHVSDNTITTR